MNIFNSIKNNDKDVFLKTDGKHDLPSKLTSLFKRGIGRKRFTLKKRIDHPVTDKHAKKITGQFEITAYDHYIKSIAVEIDRRKSFEDYRVMDFSPEISSALDIYADESLTKNEFGDILSVESDNKRIKEVLENLFYDVLNIDDNLWGWTRNSCKFGNHFMLLDVQPRRGVVGFSQLPVNEIMRKEAYDGDVDSVKFVWEVQNEEFDQWQVAHFRMLSNQDREPYGTSSLEAGRMIWKQLQLAEDAMLIYRITRAPERRIFYVDVGNISPDDVDEYMKSVKERIKRTPVIDPVTGAVDSKYNAMSIDEDIFVPRRGDKNTEIDTLPGACLALDTKIPLLNGETKELSEIINEYDNGNTNMWVYSIDPKNGSVTPAPISWAGITRKNADVIKVTLDNGKSIRCTPDHKFPTWSKGICEAKDLVVGDSMMPFNRKTNVMYDDKDYEQVYDHKTKSWKYTHRLVRESVDIKEFVFENNHHNKHTIHHKDFNRFNNNPSNLLMNSKDHMTLHSKNGKYAVGKFWEKFKNNEEFRKKITSVKTLHAFNMHKNMSNEEKTELYEKVSRTLRKTISEYDDDKRQQMLDHCRNMSKLGIQAFNEKIKRDEKFKNMVDKKRSNSTKLTMSSKDYKKHASSISKNRWNDDDYVALVMKDRKIKFTNKMLNIFVDEFKKLGSFNATVDSINNNIEFMEEFKTVNTNVISSFDRHRFKMVNADKMIKSFGFSGRKEFKENVSMFNHKIVSIETLTEKEDTGTITVDANHIYTDNHTFALECGIFTKNSNLDEIADIEYMQQKLYTSLKIPKAYFSDEEDINSKATLASQDFRFARTINRIQQSMLSTLYKIAITHLFSIGFRENNQLTGFELVLTNPSIQSEQEKLELLNQKTELFKNMWDDSSLSPVSYVWASSEIFNFSDDQIKKILDQQFLEGKMKIQIEKSANSNGKAEPPVDQPGGKVDDDTANDTPNDDVMGECVNKMLQRERKTRKSPQNRIMYENSLEFSNIMSMLSELKVSLDKKSLKLEKTL